MSNAASPLVLLEQYMPLAITLLIHKTDTVGWWCRVVRPLAPKPITEFFSANWSSTTTDAKAVDDPKIGSFSSVNFRVSSQNHGVREVVGTVVVVGIAAHTRVGVLVPSCLQ